MGHVPASQGLPGFGTNLCHWLQLPVYSGSLPAALVLLSPGYLLPGARLGFSSSLHILCHLRQPPSAFPALTPCAVNPVWSSACCTARTGQHGVTEHLLQAEALASDSGVGALRVAVPPQPVRAVRRTVLCHSRVMLPVPGDPRDTDCVASRVCPVTDRGWGRRKGAETLRVVTKRIVSVRRSDTSAAVI